MDSDYVQQVRHKLQRRLKRLNAAIFMSFHWVWLQTWRFLEENEITHGILEDLGRRFPRTERIAEETLGNRRIKVGDTEAGNVAICYWMLRKCASRTDYDYLQSLGNLLGGGGGGIGGKDPDACVNLFRKTYVEPLFDYLEEQIDDKRMTLMLLRKYKHRCEWFRREELLNDSKKGETTLVYDLYEYLHDQGLQFHIEPKSASGRVDLISAQSGKDRLVADAKIFNLEGSQKSSHIVEGFRQVYEYTKDFNEPFGYLVIFKICEGGLSIPTENQESGIPFITHNNKCIFFVIIDIFNYEKSASERGKLKAYEILPDRFVESLSPAGSSVNKSP
jgi:hypothetical protein